MDYGMPFLIEFNDIEQGFIECSRLGLNFIELNMNLPLFQLDRINKDEILLLKEKYGIYCTIHLDENFNPFDFNSLVAEAYKKTFLQTVELAQYIGAPIINMHMPSGVYFTLPHKKQYLYEKYESYYDQAISSFKNTVVGSQNLNNINICIENCEGFKNFEIKALENLLDCQKIKLTFDVGHWGANKNNDIIFYNKNLQSIEHIHLHDYNLGKNHLTLGEGDLFFDKDCVDLINKAKRTVIEVKTLDALKKSVEFLNKCKF